MGTGLSVGATDAVGVTEVDATEATEAGGWRGVSSPESPQYSGSTSDCADQFVGRRRTETVSSSSSEIVIEELSGSVPVSSSSSEM